MELFLTCILALVAPGAGQIYAGRYASGVFFGAVYGAGLYAMVPLCARMASGTDVKVKIAYWSNILYACLLALSVADAVIRCWRHPPAGDFPAGRLWPAAVFALCAVTAHRNLRRPNLIDALADMPGFSRLILYRRKADTAD